MLKEYDMVENEGIVCNVLILILMEHAQREVWRIGIQNGAAQS